MFTVDNIRAMMSTSHSRLILAKKYYNNSLRGAVALICEATKLSIPSGSYGSIFILLVHYYWTASNY